MVFTALLDWVHTAVVLMGFELQCQQDNEELLLCGLGFFYRAGNTI